MFGRHKHNRQKGVDRIDSLARARESAFVCLRVFVWCSNKIPTELFRWLDSLTNCPLLWSKARHFCGIKESRHKQKHTHTKTAHRQSTTAQTHCMTVQKRGEQQHRDWPFDCSWIPPTRTMPLSLSLPLSPPC